MSNQESSLFKDALLRLTTNKLSLFSLIYIFILVFVALITPFIAPYDYAYQDLALGASPPSPDHLLGTDTLGRDLFSRMIYGSQIVLLIAPAATIVAYVVGISLGLPAGYIGGRYDTVLSFLANLVNADRPE